MKLRELEKEIKKKLDANLFNSVDKSINGVQVGDLDMNIKRVALMVDSSLEGFIQAKKQNADLIFTHHGLFWGKPLAITGAHFNRVKYLLDNNMALCTMHLPLDSHMELGNGIALAELIGLKSCEPFAAYKGLTAGVKGILDPPVSVDEVKKRLVGDNEPVYIIPGGKNKVSTVGIASGDSPHTVYEAINNNIDLFITGDKSHEVYHTCLEEKINMICAGHYSTEVYGVQRVGKWLEKEFGLETIFIDLPTGA